MINVKFQYKTELPEEYKESLSENGCGSDEAKYLVVRHNEKIIFVESDAMEPEDARFSRDLNWIKGIIELVYKIGYQDAIQEAHQ